MNALRQSLQDAIALASKGAATDAIRVLDVALTEAIRSGESSWISLIGRNLAIICEHENQLPHAVKSLRRVIDIQPLDRRSIYQLAGLLEKLGDDIGSNSAFAEALKLARQENDRDLLELLSARGFE